MTVLPEERNSSQASISLCCFPRCRSATLGGTLRMALYPQARQLARHGRIRTRRADGTVSGPAPPRQADIGQGGRSLAGISQPTPCQGKLAIHNRRRRCQIAEALPTISMTQATRALRRPGWKDSSPSGFFHAKGNADGHEAHRHVLRLDGKACCLSQGCQFHRYVGKPTQLLLTSKLESLIRR